MRLRRLSVLLVSLVALAAAGTSSGAVAPSAAAKSCSAGYVHAKLSWGEKCLRAGEFCKIGNHEYLKFGFYCPSTGHLRRR